MEKKAGEKKNKKKSQNESESEASSSSLEGGPILERFEEPMSEVETAVTAVEGTRRWRGTGMEGDGDETRRTVEMAGTEAGWEGEREPGESCWEPEEDWWGTAYSGWERGGVCEAGNCRCWTGANCCCC